MIEGNGPAAGGEPRLTAREIAEAVGGRVVGDDSAAVRAIAPLDRASADELSFLSSARYAALYESSRAGVVLLPPELADSPGSSRARIVVAKPHEALLSLLPRLYRQAERVAGIHPTAVIGRGARLGSDVSIGPFAVIGEGASIGDGASIDAHCAVGSGVEVGEGTRLYPSVTLYPGARIGKRVILHSGVRVGSDGFGYVQQGGRHVKIPHVGRAIVEDDVEIGANSTVDRGSIDDTVIGAGSKLDNMVHVGHNVRIGRLCLLMAQVGIAGSTRVEDGCILAGQSGLAGHITIGRGARIAGGAGVFGSVPAGETWSGYPARPHKEWLRAQASLFKLSSLMRPLERLLRREGGEA